MSKVIKIFLADDHPIVRDGLRSVLETQDDFVVVGEANDGVETLEKLEETPTDILFLDLGMPKKDGLQVIEEIQKRKSNISTIVFTVFDSDERIVSAIRAGAKGYLLKGASHNEIFNAIRIVSQGGSLLQPIVASKLMDHLTDGLEKLSPRELEVLQHIAKGDTNAYIAKILFISERTVKFHVSAILSKLHAHNRTEAVRIAIERGIIST